MVVNIRLRGRTDVTPDDEDSMGRAWYGYDPREDPAELWASNRGRYSLSRTRLADERYATFVFEGKVVLVAEFHDWEVVDHPEPREKLALIGRPLLVGHPVRDALLGTDVGRGRFTIWYTPDPVADGASSDSRRAVLLTWNPDKGDWAEGYEDAVERTALGEELASRWSTGSRRSGLGPGDRALLLRQGSEPRGIVAAGRVTSDVYEDAHWDGSGGIANYVDVTFDVVVQPDEVLPVAELREAVPSQNWSPQGSGSLVRTEDVEAVEQLWGDHLDRLVGGDVSGAGASGKRSGQGRMLDPVLRKKIEDAAQDRLMASFRDDGWQVQDTRYGNPYDAVATRNGETRYLEAKGTITPGGSVVLTRGEVEHARSHPGEWTVGIWSGIRFLDDGELDGDAGAFEILTVTPAYEHLEVIDYRWRVPR